MLTNNTYKTSQRESTASVFLLLYSTFLSIFAYIFYIVATNSGYILTSKQLPSYLNLLNEQTYLSSIYSHTFLTSLISIIPPKFIPLIFVKLLLPLNALLGLLIYLIISKLNIIKTNTTQIFLLLASINILTLSDQDISHLLNLELFIVLLLFIIIAINKLGKFFLVLLPLLLIFGLPSFLLALLISFYLLKILAVKMNPSYLLISYRILFLLCICLSSIFLGKLVLYIFIPVVIYLLLKKTSLEIKFIPLMILLGLIIFQNILIKPNFVAKQILTSNFTIEKLVGKHSLGYHQTNGLSKLDNEVLVENLRFSGLVACKAKDCSASEFSLSLVKPDSFAPDANALYYPYTPQYYYKLVIN